MNPLFTSPNEEHLLDGNENSLHRQRSSTNPSYSPSSFPSSSSSNHTLHSPIYVDSKQSWELTWPIWHMLPRAERKIIARQYGYNTIGDFEEYMSLSRALNQDDSSEFTIHGDIQSSQDHTNIHDNNNNNNNNNNNTNHSWSSMQSANTTHTVMMNPRRIDLAHKVESVSDEEEGDNNHDSLDNNLDNPLNGHTYKDINFITSLSSPLKTEHQQQQRQQRKASMENGGRILLLPDDILIYRVLAYLDVDYFALCALVSPHWKSFTRTEAVYREICHRCYLQQSKRKELHVTKFGNSYRNMLYLRPRVKTGGGLYVLKFSQIKKIQRDMWTEIPIGAVLETTYYRYAYFQENSQVLYALSPIAPHEMIPKFVKIRKEGSALIDHKSGILWGSYQVQKFQVTIHVSHAWHDVKLELKILENGCDEAPGRFWALSLERHFSSASGDFDECWSRDLVEYTVPHQPFMFLRDWRL